MTMAGSGGPGPGGREATPCRAPSPVPSSTTSAGWRAKRGSTASQLIGETRSHRGAVRQTTWLAPRPGRRPVRRRGCRHPRPTVARRAGEEVLRRHEGTEAADVLRSLGSPAEVLRSVAAAAATALPGATLEVVRVGDGGATVRARSRPGLFSHLHVCEFTKGMLSQVPVLFGQPPAGRRAGVRGARG